MIIRAIDILSFAVVVLGIALLVAVVATIASYIRLRDRVEVLESVVDRLDRESANAARASK